MRTPAPSGRLTRGAAAVLLGALVVLGLALVAPIGTVAAQSATENELIEADPADGATLGTSPERLVFTFAESLGPDDVFTAPVSCGNEAQATSLPDIGDEPNEVVVEIPQPLPRGTCAVSWALRDGFGETITSGLLTFSVQSSPQTTEDTPGTAAPATTVPPRAATSAEEPEGSAGGAVWLGRVLSALAILGLFGAVMLIGTAWPEGPEYVITVRFLRSLWALALLATLIFVIAFTADVTDRSFGAALSPATWVDLADAGWPGRAALARLVLVVACVWVVIRPERIIDPTSQLPAYVLPALAVITIGFGRYAGSMAPVGVALSAAHALAAAVWFGGALLVARVVVAGPGDDDLVHAIRGFNRISGPAIVVTILTGLAQVLRLVGGALFTSGHGRVVLLKTIAVAAMVFVALATRQAVRARLQRTDQLSAPNAERFRRAFTAEAGIGVVVLALSGWLLALDPAGVDDRPAYAIERQFTDPSSGLDVTVFVTPAEVGPNGIRVEVHAPAEGITNLSIAFLPPEDSGAAGVEQPIPLTGAGAAVLEVRDGLPFEVPGQWTMQLTGATDGGAVAAATTSFPVGGAAAEGATGGTDLPVATIEIVEVPTD